MRVSIFLLLFALVLEPLRMSFANEAQAGKKVPTPADVEEATRLQVFLDRAEFGPGKIDAHYGEFTLRALALYREAHGSTVHQDARKEDRPKPKGRIKAKQETRPDVGDLNLATVNPVFITYTVTEADLQSIGPVPEAVAAQAKLKSLPYKDAAEALSEKFHCDQKFLCDLNPGSSFKAGDELSVPNVEPFELSAVRDVQPGDEVPAQAANERPDEQAGENKEARDHAQGHSDPITSVNIDTKTNMLTISEGDKLVAAFPVTVGSKRTESPIGDWKVRGFEKMPTFRYDEAMLKKGERSSHFYMLPSGPNNPVGVMWIALNKKGIGLHGTSDPDGIGRSASHGCVRLANWDVVRVARRVKAGVPVTIH